MRLENNWILFLFIFHKASQTFCTFYSSQTFIKLLTAFATDIQEMSVKLPSAFTFLIAHSSIHG